MDTPREPAVTAAVTDDLSALAWVLEELRKTLETAHKALRRYLREVGVVANSDLDDVEPAILRQARHQLHQGVGALELVNLPEGALVLRSAEQLVQRFVAKPQRLDAAGVEAVEQASFALLDYLHQKLSGRVVYPVGLFAQWRVLLELNGAERVHPADLWPQDWQVREIAAVLAVAPRTANAAVLAGFEKALLSLVRQNTPAAAAALGRECASLAAAATSAEESTLWRLAAGFFQAWGVGLLPLDAFVKRTASRVIAQLRSRVKGEAGVSERLAQDLLFYCARAWPRVGQSVPLLEAVHSAYHLSAPNPVIDYNVPLYGRSDPSLLQQARKRVAVAKEVWNGTATGDTQRKIHLNEAFSLVGESIGKLYEDGGAHLARALQEAARVTARSAQPLSAELGMEVATSLLYLEAALDEADFSSSGHAAQIARLAARITSVTAGQPSAPLEPWMEELYRRVSDRQTLNSVVLELRSSLQEAERQIDQFFRSPQENGLLMAVPGLLGSMRGVLSVLGVDAAMQALARMREDVEFLLHNEHLPQGADILSAFQRLAANLGALGFLIDMLNVQPQTAKLLFHFDPLLGVLAPVMGRAAVSMDVIHRAEALAEAVRDDEVPLQAVSAELGALQRQVRQGTGSAALTASLHSAQEALQQAEQTQLGGGSEEGESTRAHVLEAIQHFVATATAPVGLDPLGPPLKERPPQPTLAEPLVFQPTGLENDDEMRQVFLDESAEVVEEGRQTLKALVAHPADLTLLTPLRRAFHTLKGSARMVGLTSFGEAAWACEQLYNHWLAAQTPSTPDLRTFTADALGYFEAWTQAIRRRHDSAFMPYPVMAAAEALREAGELMRVPLPSGESPAVAEVADAEPLQIETVDLEVSFDAANRPVLEPLQATQPMDLLWASRQSSPASPTDLTAPRVSSDLGPLDRIEIDLPLESAAGALSQEAAAPEPAPVSGVETADPVSEVLPAAVVVAGSEVVGSGLVLDIDLDWVDPAAPSWTSAGVDVDLDLLHTLPSLTAVGSAKVFDPEQTEVLAPAEVSLAASAALEVFEGVKEDQDTPEGVAVPEVSDGTPETLEVSAVAEMPAEVTPPSGLTIDPPPESQPAAVLPLPHPSPAEAVDLDDFQAQVTAEVLKAAQPERDADDDQIKVIGPLRLQIPLFNIYLNEADEVSRRLGTELSLWAMELPRPVGDEAIALAHTLAGNSATVGFTELSQLARSLEHALTLTQQIQASSTINTVEAELFVMVSDDIRRLLHQFAAGFLHAASPLVSDRLQAWIASARERVVGSAGTVVREQGGEWVPEAGADDVIVPILPRPSLPLPPLPLLPENLLVDLSLPSRRPDHDDAAAFDDGAALYPTREASELDIPVTSLTQRPFPPALMAQSQARREPEHALAQSPAEFDADIDQVDQVDQDLFPIFTEEAQELLPLLESQIAAWQNDPINPSAPTACMRTLHTFKGSARLAGAMRLGEMAHRFESAIQALLGPEGLQADHDLSGLTQRMDALSVVFEALCVRQSGPASTLMAPWLTGPGSLGKGAASVVVPSMRGPQPMPVPTILSGSAGATSQPNAAPPMPQPLLPAASVVQEASDVAAVDWSRFLTSSAVSATHPPDRVNPNTQPVRVRAGLLDRLVNLAGEVSITRSRLEVEIGQIRGSLNDLTDNLERLSRQLNDVTLQADTQLESRKEAARAAAQDFDPLELDRYTRLQELTRMMAESVNDVATVRSALQRTLQTAEDELAAQARLTRELQSDLLRTRMVEFESLSERLYRVVRLAAKETGKQVRFDIVGGSIEVDRGVLDRMTPAFEHLLRNCVTHGIETPEQRQGLGKDALGSVAIEVSQDGNEVCAEVRDDGAGLDLARIRERALAMGLISPQAQVSEQALIDLIFVPGLSTVSVLTEVAGRGVGMDVVRSEVQAMGGRIEIFTQHGQGTRFKLVLPLTTVVTQVVMLRAGARSIAVPSHLIELVQRTPSEQVMTAYREGRYAYGDQPLPFYWLGALLDSHGRSLETNSRTLPVVIVRSAQQRIALHVDEVQGNHEVVVKNLGPQLSRVPGLAGMTLLASGVVALIYNPVALSVVHGTQAQQRMHAAIMLPAAGSGPVHTSSDNGSGVRLAPLVLVVDDSLTVRRITKRLLEREGYRVVLAKDGLEALEALTTERPVVVLSDIEMPRMDGFDLLRNIRSDASFGNMPVVMITSRIAQKHRDIAVELGANHYLGKPYSEDELLRLIHRYAQPLPNPQR